MKDETVKTKAPTLEQRQAMLEMLDNCDSEAWYATVRYCARELELEQAFFAEIICRRAEREAKDAGNGHYPADHIASVLGRIGLRLTVTQ